MPAFMAQYGSEATDKRTEVIKSSSSAPSSCSSTTTSPAKAHRRCAGRTGRRCALAHLRSLIFHKRIPIIRRWHERLLDAARADPAEQVEDRASLVVGAGCAGAAEGLLADHGAGGLVVD